MQTPTLRFDQKVSLQEIITDNEQLCSAFVEYLASIHAMEAFEFWIEVELYKRILDEAESTKTAKFIFTTYLSPHSPTEINLEGRIRRELLENFSKNPNDPHLFNKAQDNVEMMLKYDCLRVFLEVNKGKVRKSTNEKTKNSKPESHALLLQRYNSLIKLEKKKVRRESFKKSISGTIRRFTTTNGSEPKSIATTLKSNSFNMESKSLSDIAEDVEGGEKREEEGEPRLMTKRARGKKIRLDPNRKWSVAVGEAQEDDTEKDQEGKDEDNKESEGEDGKMEGECTTARGETETAGGGVDEAEKRANTPNNTDWVAFEKPPPLHEAGSSEWLVGGSRTETKGTTQAQGEGDTNLKAETGEKNKPEVQAQGGDKISEREKRRSGTGLRFMCFGGTKKKP